MSDLEACSTILIVEPVGLLFGDTDALGVVVQGIFEQAVFSKGSQPGSWFAQSYDRRGSTFFFSFQYDTRRRATSEEPRGHRVDREMHYYPHSDVRHGRGEFARLPLDETVDHKAALSRHTQLSEPLFLV